MVGGVATVIRIRHHAGQLESFIAMLVAGAAVGRAGGMRASSSAMSPLPPPPEFTQQFAGQRYELGISFRQRWEWAHGEGALSVFPSLAPESEEPKSQFSVPVAWRW
ncbi:unnamed protein product [Euphydryas editha]|uniref:Uncharacterized protein n=1 Tax=Euphydryas editha TaxID=104508 RepID=A0AAU9UM26_EUPED|nr:unnamed protein product [Euphydryas editha]